MDTSLETIDPKSLLLTEPAPREQEADERERRHPSKRHEAVAHERRVQSGVGERVVTFDLVTVPI